MVFDLQLVPLGELDGVEERVCDALAAQCDGHVADDVGEAGALEHRFARTHFACGAVRPLHHLLYAFLFERGNFDDGDADCRFQLLRVKLVAALFYHIHHVEGDDDGNVDFHQLGGQVQVALEVGRVDDVDDAVRLFIDDEVAGDDLLGGVRREGIDAGQIDDGNGNGQFFIYALPFIDGDTRPVADVRRAARKGVEQRGFTAVRVARECEFQHFTLPPLRRTRLLPCAAKARSREG